MKIAYTVSYKYCKRPGSLTEEFKTLEDLNFFCKVVRSSDLEYFRVMDVSNGKILEVWSNFKYMLFDVCKGKLILVPPETQYCVKERLRQVEEEVKCIKKIMALYTEQPEKEVKRYNIDATLTEC